MKPGHYELWIIDVNNLNHTYQRKETTKKHRTFLEQA